MCWCFFEDYKNLFVSCFLTFLILLCYSVWGLMLQIKHFLQYFSSFLPHFLSLMLHLVSIYSFYITLYLYYISEEILYFLLCTLQTYGYKVFSGQWNVAAAVWHLSFNEGWDESSSDWTERVDVTRLQVASRCKLDEEKGTNCFLLRHH